ncbi:MAG: hypothetical protein HYY06_12895 [Deltaproteobacteria bacterium]|nr:hypothetical protein [Deltaproteobacteria bacterium]
MRGKIEVSRERCSSGVAALVVTLALAACVESGGFGSTTGPSPGEVGDGSDTVDGWPGERIGAGTDAPFAADRGQGVVVAPDGSLTLEQGGIIGHTLIWVANSWEGTVSKLDTRTGEELGRYLTGPSDEMDPSRTAVDRAGNVAVANRGLSSATYVLAGDCPDRNGDGVVTTSSGGAQVLPWGSDECMKWHTPVGDPGAVARGTVIEERGGLDGVFDEYVWVGAFEEQRIYEIRADDGTLTGRVADTSPTYPYGAALGPGNKIWVCGEGRLAELDTSTLEVTQHPLPGWRETYGITVDRDGNVWTGGSLQRFSPSTGSWDWPELDEEEWVGGVAADAAGSVWAAQGHEGGILRVDSATLEVTWVQTGGYEHGIAVDHDGMIWGIDFEGDTATVLDPSSLDFERVRPPFAGAYTYSDMTGYQTANALRTEGRYRHVFEGCPSGPTVWGDLRWDIRTLGSSRVTIVARTGDVEALGPAGGVAIAVVPGDEPPVDLSAALAAAGVPAGTALEIEVGLYSGDGVSAPFVRAIGVDRSCPGTIE